MGPVPCSNTHCDVTDLVNHGIPIKTQKSEYLVNVMWLFYKLKKCLTYVSQQDAPFPHIAYDYSRADWDGLRDHLRDASWEDIFKLGASAAATKSC